MTKSHVEYIYQRNFIENRNQLNQNGSCKISRYNKK